jgi:ribosomal protein S27AE
LNDVNGRPQKAKKCPKCEKGVLKLASSRDGKTQYWSCPDCGNREFEKTASK